MKQWIKLSFILLLFLACKKEEDSFQSQLIGKWELINYESEYFVNNESHGIWSYNEKLPYQYLHIVNNDSASLILSTPEFIPSIIFTNPNDITPELIHQYEFDYVLLDNRMQLTRINKPQSPGHPIMDGTLSSLPALSQYYSSVESDFWWEVQVHHNTLTLKKSSVSEISEFSESLSIKQNMALTFRRKG